jgi:hypothetical protein
MSFPGYPVAPDAGDPQQQQPLFGPQIGNPELMKLQEAIAQQLQQAGQGNGGPVSSPYEALHRAVSPLIGVLMQKHVANKQFEAQQAAMPEIAAALQSDDPLRAMMSSKSPLVQQMALQYMPEWMKSSIGLQSKIHERQAIDPMDNAKDAAQYGAHKAADLQFNQQNIPNVAGEAKAKAEATLPIDLRKIAAGQAATFAGQAETRRHNMATEGLGTDKLTVSKDSKSGYKKPWEQ